MALFLGVHKLGSEMNENQIREGFQSYKKSAGEGGINAMMAVYSMEKGFAYCVTEAESAEQVRKAHQSVSIPLEEVIEVKEIR